MLSVLFQNHLRPTFHLETSWFRAITTCTVPIGENKYMVATQGEYREAACLRSIRQLSPFTFFSSFSLRRFLRGSDVISTPGGEHITGMKLYCSSRWSWWSLLLIPAVSTKKEWILHIEIFNVQVSDLLGVLESQHMTGHLWVNAAKRPAISGRHAWSQQSGGAVLQYIYYSFSPATADIYKPSCCTIGISQSNLVRQMEGDVSNETNVKSSNKFPHLCRKIIPTKRTPALNISTTFSNPHM